MGLGIIGILTLGAATAFAQSNLNPVGTNGNVLNPGVPLTGGSPVVRGQAFGSMPSLGPLPSLGGIPSLGPVPPVGANFGAPAPAPPAQRGYGRGGGRGGGYGGGGYGGGIGGGFIYVPVPSYGGSSSGVVHNPPPGQYDPIFGGYNPGIVYQQPDSGYYGQGYAPAQSSPTVIINQNFQQEPVHPVLHDYTNVPLPPPVGNGAPQAEINAPREAPQQPAGASDATIYLISMKDHTIYPALAYWMDKDTLNYVTMSGATNRVSLSLVDRDLSVRLNEERGLQFRIPGQ